MLQSLALALAVVVAQASAPVPAGYDAFAAVLSDQQRSTINRDPRCADAKKSTDDFVSSKDPHVGLKSLVALEQCAGLSRVGDWSDYKNYVVLAAGAVAYEIGVIANEPKAYDRALKDLSYVDGYQAPSTQTTVIVGNSNTTVEANQMSESNGQRDMEAGLPMQNSKTKTHETVHASGYSGTYGELATRVGEAAQAALNQRSSKPQASH